jgi:Ca2+-transporting ATPase
MPSKTRGLKTSEAKEKLRQYGYNEIKEKTSFNVLKLLVRQFTSPIIVVLIIAAALSWGVGFLPGQEGHAVDSVLILIIVFLSGLSGFFQEYKSERTARALKKMANPTATVFRDGQAKEIKTRYLVPSDVIVLNQGGFIPADGKVLETEGVLHVNESALTGESAQIGKGKGDEVFKGTFVDAGGGIIEITATGMNTQMGSIADSLQSMKETQTSFQREIASFSQKIILLLGGVIVVFTGVAIFKYSFYQSLLTAISLAVSAIPEGLPAVLAIVLSMGAKRMARQNALVKKMAAVESAGATQIICTDKTGTLTKNEMTVRYLYNNDEVIGYKQRSAITKEADILVKCGALCNNARKRVNEDGERAYYGDQTEVALLKFADKMKMSQTISSKGLSRLSENPFSSQRKMMSVIYGAKENSKDNTLYAKGAPEILIEKCGYFLKKGKKRKLSKKDKERILKQNEDFASQGLRVLGFAYKEDVSKNDSEQEEKDMCWLGLQAMIDPPHKGVKKALADCYGAGIRVIMITGDNALTAKAIAREIGFKNLDVISGVRLDSMSDNELEKELNKGTNIFARTSPFHKSRISKILQLKYSISMTGDGVNDALAIKQADVGIAMGKGGTDVSKEASDIILLDDNFATIRNAVQEGRRIFNNIRKFLNYLLTSNVSEVIVLFFATLFLTMEEPILLPAHLLWINLLTDGLPALALGKDPAERDIMRKPPRKKGAPLINSALFYYITSIGLWISLILLVMFLYVRATEGFLAARTVIFTGFVLLEFSVIVSIRVREDIKWSGNWWLNFALLGSLGMQLLLLYTPLNRFFDVSPQGLGLFEWIVLMIGFFVSCIGVVFITKAGMKWVDK